MAKAKPQLEKYYGFEEKSGRLRIGVKVADAVADNGKLFRWPDGEFLIFFDKDRRSGKWCARPKYANFLFCDLPKSIKKYVEEEACLGWFRDSDNREELERRWEIEQGCDVIDCYFSTYYIVEVSYDTGTQVGGGVIFFNTAEIVVETRDYPQRESEQEAVPVAA